MTDEEQDARDELKAITMALARTRKVVWAGVSLQVITAMVAGYALASSFLTNELGLALNIVFGVVAAVVTVCMIGMVLDFALRTGFVYGRSAAYHEMPADVQKAMLTARIELTAKRLNDAR